MGIKIIKLPSKEYSRGYAVVDITNNKIVSQHNKILSAKKKAKEFTMKTKRVYSIVVDTYIIGWKR